MSLKHRVRKLEASKTEKMLPFGIECIRNKDMVDIPALAKSVTLTEYQAGIESGLYYNERTAEPATTNIPFDSKILNELFQ